MAKCAVCATYVRESTAPAISEYKGQVYYFRSLRCKRDFDRNPSRYVVARPVVW
ncbi:MAG: YHS domain-containing protein [Chloroflexi bacterium]|nr:YHS domain-containing protein [Chloroflexota bacterium]